MVSKSIDSSFRFWHESLFSLISWQNPRAGKDSERVEEGERARERLKREREREVETEREREKESKRLRER